MATHRPADGRHPPPRRIDDSVLLTTAAAFGGLIISTMVLAALHPAPDPNALAGGALRNNWTVPGSIIDSLHAGIVEEIVIVAIPVLIGRRAGWHPAAITALSMLLRWPFHIYHGTWSSLPLAAIWGGTHVLAYFFLRRLAPLVIFHVLQDFIPSMTETQHATLAIAVGAAYVLLLLSQLDRAVAAGGSSGSMRSAGLQSRLQALSVEPAGDRSGPIHNDWPVSGRSGHCGR